MFANWNFIDNSQTANLCVTISCITHGKLASDSSCLATKIKNDQREILT